MRAPLPALGLALLAAVMAAACVGGTDDPGPPVGVELADGLALAELVDGFSGPTQIALHPDGRLLVAELNGEERGGTGRVVLVDPDAGPEAEPEVLFRGLTTPTGVAVVGDEVWVMERRRLSRGPLAGGELTVVYDELPFNGRSETSLTATGDDTLLYGTTGSLGPDGEPLPESGILWELDPGSDPSGEPDRVPLSAGFKNAYGHTVGTDGRVWATEVSDGSFDGVPASDELVAVAPGVDHGWPRCVGDRLPVVEAGADEAECRTGPVSQALFGPGATPTSVAVAPWDDSTLVVALWRDRKVVTVATAPPVEGPHEPVEIVGGDLRPQHLLVDGDRLLVLDFDGGRILVLTST